MPEVLQNLIPPIVAGMLLLALLLFIGALRFFRLGRTEPYWRLRRAASTRGWQLFLVSLTIGFVAAAVCLFTGFAELVLGGLPFLSPTTTPTQAAALPTHTPLVVIVTPEAPRLTSTPSVQSLALTATASLTASDSPASNPLPTRTPGRATLTPTASLTAVPTATPSLTPTPDLDLTPLISVVTPRPEAALQITAIDSAVTDALAPVSPRNTLQAGITRIYFWITYSGMTDGVAWTRLLLRDGLLIQGGSYLWSGGETGTLVHFFGDAEGFIPGAYLIRLLLGERVVAEAAFTVE